jgi:sugar O-acyltransferase (sialic acid O-acetyltransferase NeuD family)
MKEHKLVIIGDGEFAEIAYEYFTHDSPYEVVGFAVEREYLKRHQLGSLPVVSFEEIQEIFSPEQHHAFVAVTYTKLNRVRTRLFCATREKGYKFANYVSSHAFVWHNVFLGENVFVFENNVIQHHVQIGHNVVLWSGNHIGHRSVIADHCYLASHVVVSGYCHIGESCFIGVNATLADHVTIGRDCLIGAGALVTKDTEPATIYHSPSSGPSKVSSLRYYGIKE